MKKYFLTGLVTLLPVAITLFIILYLVELFSAPFQGLTQHFILYFCVKWDLQLQNHSEISLFIARLLSLVFTFIIITVLGFLASKFFFTSLLTFLHKLMSRIPIVRTIYNLCYDIIKAAFGSTKKLFQKTALLPFPRKGTYALSLVTGKPPESITKNHPELDTMVFVPTAPHPVSGFLLITSASELSPIDFSAEETFKFLISCGIVDPKNPTDTKENASNQPNSTS